MPAFWAPHTSKAITKQENNNNYYTEICLAYGFTQLHCQLHRIITIFPHWRRGKFELKFCQHRNLCYFPPGLINLQSTCAAFTPQTLPACSSHSHTSTLTCIPDIISVWNTLSSDIVHASSLEPQVYSIYPLNQTIYLYCSYCVSRAVCTLD